MQCFEILGGQITPMSPGCALGDKSMGHATRMWYFTCTHPIRPSTRMDRPQMSFGNYLLWLNCKYNTSYQLYLHVFYQRCYIAGKEHREKLNSNLWSEVNEQKTDLKEWLRSVSTTTSCTCTKTTIAVRENIVFNEVMLLHQRVKQSMPESLNYVLRAKSSPRSHFIWAQRHFVNNETMIYFTKHLLIWKNAPYPEAITLRKRSCPRTVVK